MAGTIFSFFLIRSNNPREAVMVFLGDCSCLSISFLFQSGCGMMLASMAALAEFF